MSGAEIRKERTYYSAPVPALLMTADIIGAVPEQDLKRAVEQGVLQHELLMSRVVQTPDGRCFYEPSGTPRVVVRFADSGKNRAAAGRAGCKKRNHREKLPYSTTFPFIISFPSPHFRAVTS